MQFNASPKNKTTHHKTTRSETASSKKTAEIKNRQELRKYLRTARKSLSAHEQKAASLNILKVIIEHQILEGVSSCATYLSNDGEVDPVKLIEHCWENNIHATLPILHPFTAGNLLFLTYSQDSKMMQNKYGIAEPVCEVTQVVPVSNLDLLFIPLVGFDIKGNRMGMGGGYYDRTLESLYKNNAVKIVGLAHDCQQVSEIPVQNWDIPLNVIITPTRVITPL